MKVMFHDKRSLIWHIPERHFFLKKKPLDWWNQHLCFLLWSWHVQNMHMVHSWHAMSVHTHNSNVFIETSYILTQADWQHTILCSVFNNAVLATSGMWLVSVFVRMPTYLCTSVLPHTRYLKFGRFSWSILLRLSLKIDRNSPKRSYNRESRIEPIKIKG